MFNTLAFLAFIPLAFAASRTTPPSGCTVVTKSPSSGQYSTLQAAVSSLSTTSSTPQCIFIYPGTYTEQVYIPARVAQLTIYGSTTNTTSYTSNTVTITESKSQDDGLGDDATATIRAFANQLKIYNINIANTRGLGSQAVALSSEGDQQGFYGVKLTGYQDTLLANTGNAVYAKSYIDGGTDFVFGLQQKAWFDDVDLRIKASGWITANGRDSASNPSYYVFNNWDTSNVAVASGWEVADGTVYLGRPWRDYARVVFQFSSLPALINPTGWDIWTASGPNTDHVYFKEWQNTGAGASGTRASFAGSLSAAESITTLFGSSNSWVDTSYLS